MKPLDKSAHIAKHRRNLPHWEQAGCTYFITWRLGDSLPATQLREWQEDRERWLALNPQPWTPRVLAEYQREFIDRMEHWLDAGHGSCLLRRPEVRGILAGALHFFDGQRYELEGAVIMPNHVHVLVTPKSAPSARGLNLGLESPSHILSRASCNRGKATAPARSTGSSDRKASSGWRRTSITSCAAASSSRTFSDTSPRIR